jgi:hypothetical protein
MYKKTISKHSVGEKNMKKSHCKNLMRIIVLSAVLFSSNLIAALSTMQQTIELKPGWNAVYVELEPFNNNIESIFNGVAIDSVWRWIPKDIGKDFILDPNEGLLNLDGWFGYFPEPKPEAFLSNLYTISANTAYLIKLDDTVNRSITITGTPRLTKIKWRSNSFTFSGLPVVSGNEPSFGDYFSGSTAHSGQPIYKLSSAGVWELVSDPQIEVTKSGEAYWIFTQGPSSYQGLMDITLQQGESLDYRAAFTEMDFAISNLSDVTNFVTLTRLSGNTMPMKFKLVDSETGDVAWPNLPTNKVYELQPGEEVFVTLAVDRNNFTEDRMEQVLSISSEQGIRYLLNSGANTIQPLVLPTRTGSFKRLLEVPESNAGLWAGTVKVNKVSEAQTAGTEPLDVGKPFNLRVLMHVDSTGSVKLVKSVVQMWQEGTLAPSAEDPNVLEVETPGHYVLLTDDNLIPNFSGASNRNGSSAGIRYSTIAYDFNGDEIVMNGQLAVNQTLTVSLLVDSDMPTNPFFHKYHPDHNNLDEQNINELQEAFQVTREMEFTFLANNPKYPDVADPPGWGVQQMGGVFRESFTGLHKNAIFVEGEFRLSRVVATTVLNQ